MLKIRRGKKPQTTNQNHRTPTILLSINQVTDMLIFTRFILDDTIFFLYFSIIFRASTASTCSGHTACRKYNGQAPRHPLFWVVWVWWGVYGFFFFFWTHAHFVLCYIVLFFLKRPKCLLQNSSLDLQCTGFSLLYRMRF